MFEIKNEIIYSKSHKIKINNITFNDEIAHFFELHTS